ncbi:MAG: hypothetical protein ACOH5I_06705 [Oligoflexus sp.]
MRLVVIASFLTILLIAGLFYSSLENDQPNTPTETSHVQAPTNEVDQQNHSDLKPDASQSIEKNQIPIQTENIQKKTNARKVTQRQETGEKQARDRAEANKPAAREKADESFAINPRAVNGDFPLELQIDLTEVDPPCPKEPCRPLGRDGVLITGLQWQIGPSTSAISQDLVIGRWEEMSPLVHHRWK